MPKDKEPMWSSPQLFDHYAQMDHTPISAAMREVLEPAFHASQEARKAQYGYDPTRFERGPDETPEAVKVAVKRRNRSTTIKAIGLDTNLPFRNGVK